MWKVIGDNFPRRVLGLVGLASFSDQDRIEALGVACVGFLEMLAFARKCNNRGILVFASKKLHLESESPFNLCLIAW